LIDLSVVIVSYNTREMTLRCLADLSRDLAASGLRSEVVVVDNSSSDGSADAVAQAHPDVNQIRSDRNLGFGAANNRAFKVAQGEFVMLLNSDAFVHPGVCAALVRFLRERPTCAVAGPRLLNSDGSVQRSAYPFPSPLRCWIENLWLSAIAPDHRVFGDYRRWAHDEERSVPWLIGACLLARRTVIESIGGFDERFFMYAEETDWQKRIRDAGHDVRLCTEAIVTHLGGASGREHKARINRVFFDSLDRYTYKHHGVSGLMSMRLAMAIGCTLRLVGWMGMWCTASGRRALAATKVKLLAWLAWRQLTHWRGLNLAGERTI
jgi:GT2 family glycosyltransferase